MWTRLVSPASGCEKKKKKEPQPPNFGQILTSAAWFSTVGHGIKCIKISIIYEALNTNTKRPLSRWYPAQAQLKLKCHCQQPDMKCTYWDINLTHSDICMLICSNLCPDRQSGKSGGDPDARAHEIRKQRQEARILARQAVPWNDSHIVRPFWTF